MLKNLKIEIYLKILKINLTFKHLDYSELKSFFFLLFNIILIEKILFQSIANFSIYAFIIRSLYDVEHNIETSSSSTVYNK